MSVVKHWFYCVTEEIICDSDGEFPEDEMLVMLRKQRAQYELQLQYVTSLLPFTVLTTALPLWKYQKNEGISPMPCKNSSQMEVIWLNTVAG